MSLVHVGSAHSPVGNDGLGPAQSRKWCFQAARAGVITAEPTSKLSTSDVATDMLGDGKAIENNETSIED